MDEKFKIAGQNYRRGYTCSQAVFLAYANEIGIDYKMASRLMEGFGGGLGGLQEVCGALNAAIAVVSYFTSEGLPESGETRAKVYERVRRTAELFEKEYSGIRCKDILNGEKPKAFHCGMKVKDCVLIIEQVLSESRKGGGI